MVLLNQSLCEGAYMAGVSALTQVGIVGAFTLRSKRSEPEWQGPCHSGSQSSCIPVCCMDEAYVWRGQVVSMKALCGVGVGRDGSSTASARRWRARPRADPDRYQRPRPRLLRGECAQVALLPERLCVPLRAEVCAGPFRSG